MFVILLPWHILFAFSSLLVITLLYLYCGIRWKTSAKVAFFAVIAIVIMLIQLLLMIGVIGQAIYVWISLILLVIASGFAQVKLAKHEKPIVGLTLPIISFAISVVAGVAFPLVSAPSLEFALKAAISWFMLLNIPTVYWLIIFGVFHKGNRTKKELEKMNILDL